MSNARQNNFDTLRLSAAIVVLVSHSFPISYGSDATEPLQIFDRQQATFGHLAVVAFFVISGYLITRSYVQAPDPARFVRARALRILPGLLVVLLALALIMGPFMSALPLKDYLTEAPVWRFVANLSLIGFADGLPSVFQHLPFPNAVDGSLWTLHYEAECYLLVLALGMARLLNRWTVMVLLVAGLIATKFWVGGDRVVFATYFAAGAVMFFWQPRLLPSIAVVCCVILGAAALTGGLRLACATAGAYLIIYCALGPWRWPRMERVDLSYGIYIWAFPVQQIVTMSLGVHAAWWANSLVSLPVVCGIAWLSWRWVEAPALRLKERQSSATISLKPLLPLS